MKTIIRGSSVQSYILGFDIGGTKCAVNLAKVQSGIELLDRISFPTEVASGFEGTKNNLIIAGRSLLDRNYLVCSNLIAIGICCGGPLDSKRGLIFSPPHLPGWDNIPIVQIMSYEFGKPAFLHNDANANALVEWLLGAGQGIQNMVCITMSTGFGAGIIAEGKLIEGECSLAGEIGHLRLESDGPIGWNKAGCAEAYCSGAGIAAIYKKGNLNSEAIAGLAHSGDLEALEIFKNAGRQLGKVIAILIDLLNPQLIVIGGFFVGCEDLLRPSMETSLKEEALPYALSACRIVPAQTGKLLGDYASIITACYSMKLDIL